MEVAEYISDRVHKIRSEMGLSQEKFAELTGFHSTYISLLESGKRDISVANLNKLLRPLNITISEFLKDLD